MPAKGTSTNILHLKKNARRSVAAECCLALRDVLPGSVKTIRIIVCRDFDPDIQLDRQNSDKAPGDRLPSLFEATPDLDKGRAAHG